MNGYERVASRLRTLSPAEQEWLLERLPAEDRQRVIAARDAMDAKERRENDAIALQQSAADTINGWEADAIRQLLTDEPVWVAALILLQLEPPLALAVIGQMVPARAEAVRAAVAHAPDTVKPRLIEALLRALLEKSRRRDERMRRSDFAATLRRFTAENQDIPRTT